MDDEELVLVREAAERLGMKEKTLRDWIKEIPRRVHPVGERKRERGVSGALYRWGDLKRLAEARKVRAAARRGSWMYGKATRRA